MAVEPRLFAPCLRSTGEGFRGYMPSEGWPGHAASFRGHRGSAGASTRTVRKRGAKFATPVPTNFFAATRSSIPPPQRFHLLLPIPAHDGTQRHMESPAVVSGCARGSGLKFETIRHRSVVCIHSLNQEL